MYSIFKKFRVLLLLLVIITTGAGCDSSSSNDAIQLQDQATNSQFVVPDRVVVPSTSTRTAPIAPSAPNGTYTNVDGNKIPNPYSAPSAPSGATAQCRDGTYSFSQHRSGTCSHHGGVGEWL